MAGLSAAIDSGAPPAEIPGEVLSGAWTRPGWPAKTGLYDPSYEHDACGVGFLANIKNVASHDIVARGVQILCNLTHRGAVGADARDGDGAGISIQIPDAFYRAVLDFDLPPPGHYGTGILFLPQESERREECMGAVDASMARLGLKVLGWRDVPTDNRDVGRAAKATEPAVRQVFCTTAGAALKNGAPVRTHVDPLERTLYLARKQAERSVRRGNLARGQYFYFASLSCRTVLYKGLLLSDQLASYYPDLLDPRLTSAVAFVHQRYSTNTFPSWDLAQPFRLVAHNGEINTLRGNTNRMRAREALFAHPDLGPDVEYLRDVIDDGISDTAAFDNALELLLRTGRSLPHALAMMIPEAWAGGPMARARRGFFEYHATMMEPWDGPANIAAFDGSQIVAILDRNGLRPARYWITSDDEIVYASEAGVLDIPPDKIIKKERLGPGQMLQVDLERHVVLEDDAIKQELATLEPFSDWLDEHRIEFEDLPAPPIPPMPPPDGLRRLQQAFGYTAEDLRLVIAPMAIGAQEPVGSMGNDSPQAVLSRRAKPLFNYFTQLFAQVTNPPIDPIREEVVMSLQGYLGAARNILVPSPEHCRMLRVKQPILTNAQLEQLRQVDLPGFRGATLSTLFNVGVLTADDVTGARNLERKLDGLCREAEAAVDDGFTVLVLSDRGASQVYAPIPSLLAVGAIHHHLIRAGKRTQCSLIVETGEAREVHHFACLIGFGAAAVNPYLALDSIRDMVDDQVLPPLDGNVYGDQALDAYRHYRERYIKAVGKGLRKVLSKMGVSTLQSYCGAQIFEVVGLGQALVDRYFTGTATRVEGVGLEELTSEVLRHHRVAWAQQLSTRRDLDRGGDYSWRRDGELHMMNPEVIALLQHSVRANDRALFKKCSALIDEQSKRLYTFRGMFRFKPTDAIPLEEVEPASEIMQRFCTGGMSLGSISTEAHETVAIAMNRIGGKSNTGEGGEDPRRFTRDENGDLRSSAIKQVASGRFGVTPHYLVNAKELQIKIAQGAKPGEGGQLPGHKVSEYIGGLRHSVPGVTLISPPPHHDIYSIEDLAQLIFDLKNVNPAADVSVKLVSEMGVGTVAAGVSKGHADTVIIAGCEGGTGASPMSSVKHAGIPWEIGLAETQQTLVLNDLRSRIKVQVDGMLRTGRDVVIAAMLGAEEFGFGTVALVAMGCIMMRKCHLNTCPVGIATQDPELRKKFEGVPDQVVNYFELLAEEVREHMARLGVRKLDELVGRSKMLEMDEALHHWKTGGLDFTRLFEQPLKGPKVVLRRVERQRHAIDDVLDRKLIELAKPAFDNDERVRIDLEIKNSDRSVGTMLSGEVARRRGPEGLPASTIELSFRGSAGQSFGAFLAEGIDVKLFGEANDYVGKGMNGGRLVIRPDLAATFPWEDNSIVGNTVLYGATGGEVFFAGRAGERFCVRNSGVAAVVEGVGDHGCEYMTGGLMICLGRTGRNFAAGMSGGLAFILDEDWKLAHRCNQAMVFLEKVSEDDAAMLEARIRLHHELTDSPKAKRILDDWTKYAARFVKVFPREYRRVLAERQARGTGSRTGLPVVGSTRPNKEVRRG